MRVELSEEERLFLQQLLARAMERLGDAVEQVDPDSAESHRMGSQLAFVNGLLAKMYPPVEATEAEQTAAEAAGPSGVLSGDLRRLIDWLHLEAGRGH